MLLLVAVALQTSAQKTAVPLDPTIKTGKLANGLTYFIQKNSVPEKRVELRLVVNSGSVQEDIDQLGMAHFVEHMCFNGTSHFPKNDLIHYLQSVGVNFGPEINGYTSFDETVYMLTVPSDSAHVLANGIQIMADWAGTVTFDDAEIEKERGVITEEWRLGRGAWQRMSDQYIPVLLKGSKYAERLPIGTKESITGSTPDAIKRFYKDWYRPDLMAFVVVGDIDPAQIEKMIQNDFSALKAPAMPRTKEVYPVENNKEPLISIVSDKENTNVVVRLAFKQPKKEVKTLDDYREQVTQNLFCQMLNVRLDEITQKENAPFIYAESYYGSMWVRPSEAFQAYIQVKEDGAVVGLESVMTEIERVKRYGFTQPELDRLKLTMLKNAETAYNDRDKQESGNLVDKPVYYFLENNPTPGITFEYQFLKDKLSGITLAEVNQWAKQWIKDENRVLIVQGIDKEGVKLPLEADIHKVIDNVAVAKIEPYKEAKLASSLMATLPVAGKIVSEKAIGTKGITELKLSNGVTVLLKPTDFKNDEIKMEAYSAGGTSLFGVDYKLSAMFAGEIERQSGVAQFSGVDLGKMLSGKTVSVSPQISDLYSGFSGQSSVADVETMLQLVNLYFTQPRRDESVYNSFVQNVSAQYKNVLSNPVYYFYNQMLLFRYNNNPETPGSLPTDAEWSNMSLNKVFDVYQRIYANASNYTFVFVGSFKPETLRPMLETYLGSLPSTGVVQSFVDKKIVPIEGPASKDVLRGTDPKTYVSLSLAGPAKWSREDSHALWSLCNILERVYIDKLREEMSGVYGFGIGGDVVKDPSGHYEFNMTIPCAPDNADKLVDAVIVELNRMRKEGPTADELQKEVESQRRAVEKGEKENGEWMFRIIRSYQTDKDFGRIEKPYALCEMLTPELMKQMAVKYLDPAKLVRVTLYPENYTKTTATK